MQLIDIQGGQISLEYLRDGKLVIASYKGKKTGVVEVQKALGEAGISFGLNESTLPLVAVGDGTEFPVARAYIRDEPPRVEYLFEDRFDTQNFQQFTRGGAALPDGLQRVKKDQLLVKVTAPPGSVIQYPDGLIEPWGSEHKADILAYAGAGTYCSDDHKKIFAADDGIACRNSFGEVTVYPAKSVKSIGKALGSLYFESALSVKADIRSESQVEALSSLIVEGVIRASRLEIGGNIIGKFGLDNPRKLDMALARAGQSIMTTAVRNYNLWAGQLILLTNSTENSHLECLNTVVSPLFKGCEVRAGSKVYAGQIGAGCHFYLGRSFISDEKTDNMRKFHIQHQKRLQDSVNKINSLRDSLAREKNISLRQVSKLNRISTQMIPNDSILNRSYATQVQTLEEYKANVEEFARQVNELENENLRFSQYEKQFKLGAPPELFVYGRVAPGTIVSGPSDKLIVEEEMGPTVFRVESNSGKIEVEKLAI